MAGAGSTLLALTGCGEGGGRFADEREVCEAWLDCASEVAAENIASLIDQYGEASACWDDPDQAALCATACQESAIPWLGQAAEQLDRCAYAAAGPDQTDPVDCVSTIDSERYLHDFVAVMCAESRGCGDGSTASIWCVEITESGNTPSTYDCPVDPVQACDCLAAEFTCVEDTTGYAYVEAPAVCEAVHDCLR